MNTYSLYDATTGLFNGRTVQCIAEHVLVNIPEGLGCVIGQHDALAERVDMETGLVVDYQPPAPSDDHQWDADTKRWLYVTPLADLQARAIVKTFADVDAVIRDAVGNRTTEYQDAEAEARTFKAAGYVGGVSEDVSSYALHNRTGTAQTDQWAADEIIVRADAFRAAQRAMRTTRFVQQGAMQAAATVSELDAATVAWDGFIAALRAQLGLSN